MFKAFGYLIHSPLRATHPTVLRCDSRLSPYVSQCSYGSETRLSTTDRAGGHSTVWVEMKIG